MIRDAVTDTEHAKRRTVTAMDAYAQAPRTHPVWLRRLKDKKFELSLLFRARKFSLKELKTIHNTKV